MITILVRQKGESVFARVQRHLSLNLENEVVDLLSQIHTDEVCRLGIEITTEAIIIEGGRRCDGIYTYDAGRGVGKIRLVKKALEKRYPEVLVHEFVHHLQHALGIALHEGSPPTEQEVRESVEEDLVEWVLNDMAVDTKFEVPAVCVGLYAQGLLREGSPLEILAKRFLEEIEEKTRPLRRSEG